MMCALPTLAERRGKANTAAFSEQACIHLFVRSFLHELLVGLPSLIHGKHLCVQ